MDGLNSEQVIYRKNNSLSNENDVNYTNSTKKIVLSNTITLFNILHIINGDYAGRR